IQTAETALAEGRSREVYDKLSYDLMMRTNDLKFKIKNQVLVERRVKEFRDKHQGILNKDLTTVNAQDKKAREQADWMYTRLGAAAQKVAEADMRRINLVKEITNQTDHSELAVAATALKGLINNAKADQNQLHYLSLRQELQTMLAQIENNPSAVDIKVAAQTLQVKIMKIKQRDADAQQWEAQVRYQYRHLLRRSPDDVLIADKDQVEALLAAVYQKTQELNVSLSDLEQLLKSILSSIERRSAPAQTQPPVVTPPAPSQPTTPVEKPTEGQNQQPSQPSVEKKPDTTTPKQPKTTKDNTQTSEKPTESQIPSVPAQPSTPNKPAESNPTQPQPTPPASKPVEEQSQQSSAQSPKVVNPAQTLENLPAAPKTEGSASTKTETKSPTYDKKQTPKLNDSSIPKTNKPVADQKQSTSSSQSTTPAVLKLEQTVPNVKQQISGLIKTQADKRALNPLGEVERPRQIASVDTQKTQSTHQDTQVTQDQTSSKVDDKSAINQVHESDHETNGQDDRKDDLQLKQIWPIIAGGCTILIGTSWWLIVARRRRR
ncbi:MAG: hypothetical protein Q3996_00855, partial [Candidatus Saccharibacteria bacterium]|nr:hypothetical protein [Candidatus Saccharibacteria bacterium]